MRAPLLVLGIGNPSRGDDAIGPLLIERLADAAPPGVEVLGDFQLQVEHALDLQGRRLVLFIDACIDDAPEGCELRELTAADDLAHTSHALTPAQLLGVYRRVLGEVPPPAFVLAVRGEAFELGAPLSAAARAHTERAWQCLLHLVRHPDPGAWRDWHDDSGSGPLADA